VCKKLRDIYYPDKKWAECYGEVAMKFSLIKKIAKKFYSHMNDREILSELNKYSNCDIEEAIGTFKV
jgi:hypothetical protein